MSFALHALAADFQNHSAEILAKVQVDGDFADLVAQYLDINAKVYRAEAEFDLMTAEVRDHLSHARAALRGHIGRHLNHLQSHKAGCPVDQDPQ